MVRKVFDGLSASAFYNRALHRWDLDQLLGHEDTNRIIVNRTDTDDTDDDDNGPPRTIFFLLFFLCYIAQYV